MIQAGTPKDTFTWTGQPVSEWPNWMIFRNYGVGEDRLVIHVLGDPLVARRGDTIAIDAKHELWIVPAATNQLAA